MKNNKKLLLKHFSGALRKRALADNEIVEVSPGLLNYLTRKELIQIISEKFNGTIPKEHNLVELENEDLLQIIGDDLFIISFVIKQWTLELKAEKVIPSSTASISDTKTIVKTKAPATISKEQKKKK